MLQKTKEEMDKAEKVFWQTYREYADSCNNLEHRDGRRYKDVRDTKYKQKFLDALQPFGLEEDLNDWWDLLWSEISAWGLSVSKSGTMGLLMKEYTMSVVYVVNRLVKDQATSDAAVLHMEYPPAIGTIRDTSDFVQRVREIAEKRSEPDPVPGTG